MNTEDFFNPNEAGDSAQLDLSLEDALKARTSRIIKSSHNGTSEEVVSEVNEEIDGVIAMVVTRREKERKNAESKKEQLLAKANGIQRKLDTDGIPQSRPGEETFHLTTCLWRRVVGLGLGGNRACRLWF